MSKTKISLILGLMCVVLTSGICVQIRTINNTNSAYSSNETINNLRDEVLRTKEKYDNIYEALENAEKKLEEKRENVAQNNTELENLEKQIKDINKVIGFSEVTGEGIILTLEDSHIKSTSYLGDPNDLLIHDLDLINIINELKNAGAEAISINGQRIVSTSAIECDGNVVKINGVKIGVPFEIKAIGLSAQLAGIARTGGYLEYLESYGIITELKKEDKVTIPKYTGAINVSKVEE